MIAHLAWTPADDAILREHYATRGPAWCASEIGRTLPAVYRRAQALGVKNRPAWSDREDGMLAMMWGVQPIPKIAEAIGRTSLAVYGRAYELELGRGCPRGHEHLSNAAVRAGYDKDTMRRILRWANVHIAKAVAPPRPGSVRELRRPRWTVDPADVDEAVARWCATEPVHCAADRLDVHVSFLRRLLLEAATNGDTRVPPKPRGRRHWRVPSRVCDELLAEYRRRETIGAAARRFGVDRITMHRWLEVAGITCRPFGRLDPDLVDRVVAERLGNPKCRVRRAA